MMGKILQQIIINLNVSPEEPGFVCVSTEKHEDGHGAGQNVRHPLLRHFLQTEAAGDQDSGRVQGGAGVPETSADSQPPAASGPG